MRLKPKTDPHCPDSHSPAKSRCRAPGTFLTAAAILFAAACASQGGEQSDDDALDNGTELQTAPTQAAAPPTPSRPPAADSDQSELQEQFRERSHSQSNSNASDSDSVASVEESRERPTHKPNHLGQDNSDHSLQERIER